MSDDDQLSLLEFASSVYQMRGWSMPNLHVRMYAWLEDTEGDRSRVLQCFRGSGKSTVLGIYLGWSLHCNPTRQALILGADDSLSSDMSRDVLMLAESHPLLTGSVRQPPAVRQWWTEEGFAANPRVPTLKARGVMSRLTGSRADLAVLDDPEVPRNCETDEARRKLRKRISELTHVMKPGGSRVWLGTPHTHASLYPEQIAAGAASLTVKLFAYARRFEDARQVRYLHGVPEGVTDLHAFVGVGPQSRLLAEGADYRIDGEHVVLREAPGAVLDLYAGCAWPERFTRTELAKRRRECRTLHEFDSQYQLEALPLDGTRLSPDLMKVYDDEPEVRHANGAVAMMLGATQIVSATLRLDPASNKPKSDTSAACLVLADAQGRYYWHRATPLTGSIADVDEKGAISGGMAEQVADLVEQFELGAVEVETNGIGGTWPALLRGVLRKRGLACGVREKASSTAKVRRILGTVEPALRSGILHCHRSVLRQVETEMRDWSPVIDGRDDYLDALAGALAAEPVRVGKAVSVPKVSREKFGLWRPDSQVFTAEFEDRTESLLDGADPADEDQPYRARLR